MHAIFERSEKLKKPRALLPALLADPKGIWVDAACGDGVFAQALLELSLPGTQVIGIDRRRSALLRFTAEIRVPERKAVALQADLNQRLPVRNVDGLILANGLHYFDEAGQAGLLRRCADCLRPCGQLVIVEYNTTARNHAVPHPVPLSAVGRILSQAGFHAPQASACVRSTFLGEMYALSAELTRTSLPDAQLDPHGSGGRI